MAAEFTPKAGDTVYSIHGQAGCYVAPSSSGHVVEPMYDHDADSEPHFGSPTTWREVFLSPPTERLHAEIAKQQERLAELQRQIQERRAEVAAFDEKERTTRERLARHSQLAYIDAVLERRITHFVTLRPYYDTARIRTLAEVLTVHEDGRQKHHIPLLALALSTKGYLGRAADRLKLDWLIDDEGEYTVCIPCQSEQEARDQAWGWINGKIDAARAEHKDKPVPLAYIMARVDNLKKLSLPVREADEATWRLARKRAIEQEVESRQKDLQQAQQRLEQAEEAARAAGVVEGSAT